MEVMNPDDFVYKALKEHLFPCRIARILKADEFDSDGDPILRMRVVIDQSGPEPDANKLFTATGLVREVLAMQKDNRFPLLTYPSSEEFPEVAA